MSFLPGTILDKLRAASLRASGVKTPDSSKLFGTTVRATEKSEKCFLQGLKPIGFGGFTPGLKSRPPKEKLFGTTEAVPSREPFTRWLLVRCRSAVIAIDDAFLHDEEDVLGLADVLEGVTGNGDDIRKLAGFKRADFVGQAEEIGVGGCSRLECINGFHAQVNHLVELFGITPVRIDGGVCAQADFDAFGDCALKSGMEGIGRGMRFGGDGRGDIEAAVKFFLAALNGHKCRHKVGAVLLHQVESFFVQEAAMLDGIDAGADGALGGFGTVGMSSRLAPQSVSFVDNRVEFLLSELRSIHVVGRREYPA